MRRHLSEFSKSPLDACVPTAPRLESRGPAAPRPASAAALPPLRSRPQRLALASPEQFIAVQYVRSANFALRG